jgi:cell division protein FtsW (lipid II flippase)
MTGMTYFWSAVVVVLVLGIGLIVGGSLSGPGRDGRDLSARRSVQMQVGAVMVGVSLCVLVIAYFTAAWP